jgi:hypothetical protein
VRRPQRFPHNQPSGSPSQSAFKQKPPAKTTQKPPGANAFAFSSPRGYDARAARWHLWLALSEVGYFVKQLYLVTCFLKHAVPTCDAGHGSPGQVIVYTHDGTILCLPSTYRLYCENPKRDLLQRLAMKFPAFSKKSTSHATQYLVPQQLDFSLN